MVKRQLLGMYFPTLKLVQRSVKGKLSLKLPFVLDHNWKGLIASQCFMRKKTKTLDNLHLEETGNPFKALLLIFYF